MSTINAILEPDANGNLLIPVPPELRHSKVKVEAKLERADMTGKPQFGCLAGKISVSPEFDEPLDDFKDYME